MAAVAAETAMTKGIATITRVININRVKKGLWLLGFGG